MERENEFEDTGANYPDEGGSTTAAPPSPAADDPAVATNDEPEAASADEQVASEQQPSHQAVGIGVQDTEARDGGGAATSAEADASTDHHGQDGDRDTLTVSEAQQSAGALGREQEQRLPAMAQNNASEIDKIAGIVAQTRGDIGTKPREEIERVLAQRFEQSGIELPAETVAELAQQISIGDAAGPE